MAFKVKLAPRRHHRSSGHTSRYSPSFSGSNTSGSWPFGSIKSISSSETEIVVRRRRKKRDTNDFMPPHVLLPDCVQWPTKETSAHWERDQARAADTSIVCLDSNVASLILDGEAFERAPCDLYNSLPALATAVMFARAGPDNVARVQRSKKAHCWLKENVPPRPALRPKIKSTVVDELKASKQVNNIHIHTLVSQAIPSHSAAFSSFRIDARREGLAHCLYPFGSSQIRCLANQI